LLNVARLPYGGITLELTLLHDTFTICRLSPEQDVPPWVWQNRATLLSITYTADELSIVCPQSLPPSGVQYEGSWKAIRIQGPLDFSLTGILVALAAPLAAAHIPIFALSTFDTDYILIQEQYSEQARGVLEENGHVLV
jgi:hypothetical protein